MGAARRAGAAGASAAGAPHYRHRLALAAGYFYGLISGATPDDALRPGWAHGALVASYPGDTTMATVDQVRALAKGGSARILG